MFQIMFLQVCLLVFVPLVYVPVQSCTSSTFEGTRITALKHIALKDEVTDYNYFTEAKGSTVIPIHRIYGCITSTDEFVNAVALQIRGEQVPIFYEGAIQNLPFLHSLHVVSSEVSELRPRAFQNLPSITIIKIQDNNIHRIPANVFNNLMVRKLILTFNNITHIHPEAFNDMPRLESIKLDFNKLFTWSTDWFVNCPRVEYLSMKFNKLTEIPARAFRNIQETLERLYLSDNRIRSVSPRAFSGLRKLTDLSLHSNKGLSELDEWTFLYLENLKLIDLSGTNITCLSDPLLNTLRADILLWIDDTPLKDECKPTLDQWAMDNENILTFYRNLKNITTEK